MPLATEPVNFTWSLPSLTCRHGVTPQDADFRGEFFQKVKETKTTLDRIYLSSLNREKATIYDYDKWARKGGNPVENKSNAHSPSHSTKHRPRPEKGPIRPLGVDNSKIEAALHCGLWNDGKQKKSIAKMPHIMARVQCYDFDDDYQSDAEKANQQGSEYTLDSSRVFRVMQEETRERANQRLKKGSCGRWKVKKRTRQISPSMVNHVINPVTNHVSESEDEYTSSEIRVTIEEEISKRRGGIVTKVTHKQKLDFSAIKKGGVTQNDTVDYRLPKLNSKPIVKEVEEEALSEDVVKLPLLEGVKTRSSTDKKKRLKHCKKLSRHKPKKKSAEKHVSEESITRPNIDDDIETELALQTPTLEEVSNKLSDISRGGSDLNSDKTSKPKLFCKKGVQEDALNEYPFMTMGIDELSSDEECLCDDCLATNSSSRQPTLDEKPVKSILTPRRGNRTSSTGSGKGVTFAGTEKLENIRLISPLAVRNENMKRFEEEDRRERLSQRDSKRRERRRRERERFAALNKKSTKRKEARYKAEVTSNNSASVQGGPETTPPLIISEEKYNIMSQGNTEVKANDDNKSSAETPGQNISKDVSSESSSLDEENDLGNDRDDGTQIAPASLDPEVHEVEALMLDPQDGRLYEDIVLEKGDGKITVAQLGYRIKSIFNRDLPHPSPQETSLPPPNEPEVNDHDNQEMSQTDDKEDEKDEPFVTKCVDWNETTESASTSRSQTPVEEEDISDFILSMKNCRYIRWTKGYADMLEKMEI